MALALGLRWDTVPAKKRRVLDDGPRARRRAPQSFNARRHGSHVPSQSPLVSSECMDDRRPKLHCRWIDVETKGRHTSRNTGLNRRLGLTEPPVLSQLRRGNGERHAHASNHPPANSIPAPITHILFSPRDSAVPARMTGIAYDGSTATSTLRRGKGNVLVSGGKGGGERRSGWVPSMKIWRRVQMHHRPSATYKQPRFAMHGASQPFGPDAAYE